MIRWEDENGKVIEKHHQGFRLIFEMMSLLDEKTELWETKCLQFIDPWGDTTFNRGQIPVLIGELKFAQFQTQKASQNE